MNYITKTEAFAHHGATLTAPRGVWAKKSDDGKFVELAAWRKGFNRDPFLPTIQSVQNFMCAPLSIGRFR
jgi:hypothetical protein